MYNVLHAHARATSQLIYPFSMLKMAVALRMSAMPAASGHLAAVDEGQRVVQPGDVLVDVDGQVSHDIPYSSLSLLPIAPLH